jgi:hypothetical protein
LHSATGVGAGVGDGVGNGVGCTGVGHGVGAGDGDGVGDGVGAHVATLQKACWYSGGHGAPPSAMTGREMRRRQRSLEPVPHVAEHASQLDHMLTTQSGAWPETPGADVVVVTAVVAVVVVVVLMVVLVVVVLLLVLLLLLLLLLLSLPDKGPDATMA